LPLEELRPDLVALPESVVTDDYDQVRDLLGPKFHIAHQKAREPGDGTDVEPGQGHSLASRWPLGETRELDLHLTPRTEGFAVGLSRSRSSRPSLWDRSSSPSTTRAGSSTRRTSARCRPSQRRASWTSSPKGGQDTWSSLRTSTPIRRAASARFWTGRQALGGTSVCYRDAWESAHPGEPGHTFTPENPIMVGRDWPFRRIDYVFVRCGEHEGPTLEIAACERIFDKPVGGVWASDHFGLSVELAAPEQP